MSANYDPTNLDPCDTDDYVRECSAPGCGHKVRYGIDVCGDGCEVVAAALAGYDALRDSYASAGRTATEVERNAKRVAMLTAAREAVIEALIDQRYGCTRCDEAESLRALQARAVVPA